MRITKEVKLKIPASCGGCNFFEDREYGGWCVLYSVIINRFSIKNGKKVFDFPRDDKCIEENGI